MNVSKLELKPDDDNGDANVALNVAKTLNKKPPDGRLCEEKPGGQREAPGLQKEGPGLHKLAGAQQARRLCPSPGWVHG